MDFSVEGLVVTVFMILPGFVSAAVRQILQPSESSTAGEWVAGSIVTSVALNALVVAIFFGCKYQLDLAQPISTLSEQLSAQTGRTAISYVVGVYIAAVLWGLLSGWASSRYAPRVLAYRFRLTPISPSPNVFSDKLNDMVRTRENLRLRGSDDQKVPWLRIKRKDADILGRLTKSSIHFEVDEPFEAFLAPAFVLDLDRDGQGERVPAPRECLQGLYLRVAPEDLVEIFVAPASWQPGVQEILSGSTTGFIVTIPD